MENGNQNDSSSLETLSQSNTPIQISERKISNRIITAVVLLVIAVGVSVLAMTRNKPHGNVAQITNPDTAEVKKVSHDLNQDKASFYFMVSEKNGFVQHVSASGTYNENLPTITSIMRYDTNPEKLTIVKKDLIVGVNTNDKYDLIPRVGISSDQKKNGVREYGFDYF